MKTDDVMRLSFGPFAFAAVSAVLGATLPGSAVQAADFSNLGSYSQPYGLSPGQETQPVDPSLRDANGNLTVVNGQFTSSTMSQQSGVQRAGTNLNGSGGSNGSGAIFGGATAIGNSLNVITNGSNNTVIVTSTQTNNGDQTANVSINGK